MDKGTKEMFEILHKNKARVQTQKTIEKQIYLDRKCMDKKREKAIISGVMLSILLILALTIFGYFNDKFVEKDLKGGPDRNVCETNA